MPASFAACEICGGTEWAVVYVGSVRDGAFGRLSRSESAVGRCQTCGVDRLDEALCKDEDFYRTEEYRSLLAEPTDAAGFFAEYDILQLRNLSEIWPEPIRGKVIADVGCAAGSFLDHVWGLARKAIAIEPCEVYHESLKSRGYVVYNSPVEAARGEVDRVDFAFSFSVIEHVENPREFLAEIRELMKPDGKLLISTPNRRDILMDLLPDEYPSFFYRTVHRWYFDAESLRFCAQRARLTISEARCRHRFGLSNTLAWLRDRRPTDTAGLPHVDDPLVDSVWRRILENKGVGDYLYFLFNRSD